MLGKLIREAAKATGEAIAAPLTVANEAASALAREAERATEPNPKAK